MNNKSVAIIGGKGLGDNLIEMVIAQNALCSGYQTTMYSSVLYPLADWFPQHTICPSLALEQFNDELKRYDFIFCPKHPGETVDLSILDSWVDYEGMYQNGITQVENMVSISRRFFHHNTLTTANGIQPPKRLKWRINANRVCLHPTSAEISKNWLPSRFLCLADRLVNAGMQPCFIMSEPELEEWEGIIGSAFPLIGFSAVADCAKFIYESGYFIGNDSGGGHLASCLNIPTLSIHGRKRKARMWQPGWGDVEVVTPLINMIGGFLRQHYWKYFLPVMLVERRFFKLVRRMS